MSTDQLIEFGKLAAAVVAVAGLLTLLGKWLAGGLRLTRRVSRLVDEVLGDGDDQLGWGDRIAGLEKGQAELARVVKGIDHEVRPNSGASMRDQVDRIARATGAHDTDAT